jgi:hypothetical protein
VSLLGREVLGYLAASVLWMLAVAAIAAVAAFPVARLTRLRWQTAFGAGVAGAVVAASLAIRLSVPTVWIPSIGGRLLPVVWSVAGAVCGVAIALWRSRFRQEEREPGRISG